MSTMHRSFGMESRRRPVTTWKQAMRGPTRAEVRRHLEKIAKYQALAGAPSRGR